jgi:hypothetical protein
MFDLGGGRKGAEGGLGSPPTPPPARQRRSNDNDSLEKYSFVSNQRSRSVAGPPTRAVEFTLPGSNEIRTIWVATESQLREGDKEGHYMEPAQSGPSPEGQGTAITPHHPGLQPQPGGQVQTATEPIKPYSGFDEALKRWGPSGDITATWDLKWQRDVNGDMQKIKQFQEVVGGLQDFRTYLLMKPGSAFVKILHSPMPMKFVAISSSGNAQPRMTQHQSSCHNRAHGSGTRRQHPRMQQC